MRSKQRAVRSTPLDMSAAMLRSADAKQAPVPASESHFMRRRLSMEPETPFEQHLQDIYDGRLDAADGLSFFESHGYYDVSEANTVAMFRQNFGMKKFWDGDEHDVVFYDWDAADAVDLDGLQVLGIGAMLSATTTTTTTVTTMTTTAAALRRGRTASGRVQLLDDDGHEVDLETQREMEKERRMKLKQLEVDDDDLADLAHDELVLAEAVTVIRTEKTRFKRFFYQAMSDEMMQHRTTTPRAVVTQPSPSLSIQLPPYSGYLYVLKDTIPYLLRSWHKRWFHLDFNTGLAKMYKRSYWRSERGVLDVRTISNITRINLTDLCVQCYDGRSMLLRSKDGPDNADLWINLLQFARRQVSSSALVVAPPSQPSQYAPSSCGPTPASMFMMTTTTTTTMTAATAFKSRTASGYHDYFVSTKPRLNERSVLDVMSTLVASKTPNTHNITAA
ncbi:hypothetical protein ATCC90586_001789 [Pythium insidiosum]|nr:hypothetical protein ATCC90586_001789 [Pythium insidiosum]